MHWQNILKALSTDDPDLFCLAAQVNSSSKWFNKRLPFNQPWYDTFVFDLNNTANCTRLSCCRSSMTKYLLSANLIELVAAFAAGRVLSAVCDTLSEDQISQIHSHLVAIMIDQSSNNRQLEARYVTAYQAACRSSLIRIQLRRAVPGSEKWLPFEFAVICNCYLLAGAILNTPSVYLRRATMGPVIVLTYQLDEYAIGMSRSNMNFYRLQLHFRYFFK